MDHRCLFFFLVVICISHSFAVNPCTSTTSLTANSTNQYLTSYGYPANYPDEADCSWLITAPLYEFVNLEVMHMDLVNWADGCSDSLTVYDGSDANAPVIHKYCGMDRMMSRSKGQVMFVVFRTDREMNKRGFQLRYWSHLTFASGCIAGTWRAIDVPIGLPLYMEFPDYIGHNINNSDCRYQFAAPFGNLVAAEIVHWERTEALASGFMGICSGYNNTIGTLIEGRSDTAPFSQLVTADRYLWVHLQTSKKDWSNQKTKFIFKIYTVPSRVSSCSGALPVSTRSSTSPSFRFYPYQINNQNNQPCPLKVVSHSASANVRIDVIRRLGVYDFSIVPCNDTYDYLKVFDGSTTGAPQLKQMCLKNNPTYISTKPEVVIDQKTTDSYLIKAVSNDYPCNGKAKKIMVKENEEGFEDFFGKDPVPNNGYCEYLLEASKLTNVVSLSLSGDLGYLTVDSTCSKDYIGVYDGDKWTSKELGRWCGGPMKPFASSGRYLLVVVVTDSNVNTGLTAKASFFGFVQGAVCPDEVDLPGIKEMQNITSPGFPSDYPLNSHCTWRISTRIYNFIVWFVVHESTLDDNCKDIVYVYDGLTTDHENLLGRFCSKDTPTFKSTKWAMTVVFKSDNTDSMRGFKAGYYVEHVRGRNVNEGTPVGLIAGICIAVAVVGALILVLYIACCRKSNDYEEEKDEEELLD
ncbi:bone morphogenetic protein 1-like [Gigantopelta aegis]|uniref:bone morphogenetic protein 1-like n=1 Tax=Gigantopelta aegis TaxID=1735272 RepID=UPI001B88825F|nr:bone morphogenetic protein 1-like [Gigantopelta aegis]